MHQLGHIFSLEILRILNHGAYLASSMGDILLPIKYLSDDLKVGDTVSVFLYKDSEDRPVASTQKPYGLVGEYAVLECKESTDLGAFMDWGLEKDLFIPHKEQHRRIRAQEKYVVRICLDPKTDRIIGTTRIAPFLASDQLEALAVGQEVDLLIYETTDLGYMALINESYRGILYKNEVFTELEVGKKLRGFIKKLRSDGKIDLTMHKFGYQKVKDAESIVLEKLMAWGGTMCYTDQSSPEEIKKEFGLSKGVFKNALSALYKKRRIQLSPSHVTFLS
jgi:hypothetical protein